MKKRDFLFAAALDYLEKRISCDKFLESLQGVQPKAEGGRGGGKVIVLEAWKRAQDEVRKRDGRKD